MATQCFIGPGIITLQNQTSSFSVVETSTGETVGSFTGTPYNGNSSPTSKTTGVLVIGSGEFCATYPDNWGTENCNCPAEPILNFTSTRILGSSIDDPVFSSIINPGDFPGSSCANPSNVSLCELQQILDALNAISVAVGAGPDYTSILNAIQTEVAAINADTDALASINASVANLETLVNTSNVTLNTITAALGNILTEAQAINANTDSLESLITTLTTTLQTESDETQVLLQNLLNAINVVDCFEPDQFVDISEQATTASGPGANLPAGVYANILTLGPDGALNRFPWRVTGSPFQPSAGFFTAPASTAPVSTDPCQTFELSKLSFEITYSQFTDLDGQAYTDFGDMITLIQLGDGTLVDSTAISTTVDGRPFNSGSFQLTSTELNTLTRIIVTLDDVSGLSIQDALDAQLGLAIDNLAQFLFYEIRQNVEYRIVDTCPDQAIAVCDPANMAIASKLDSIDDNTSGLEIAVRQQLGVLQSSSNGSQTLLDAILTELSDHATEATLQALVTELANHSTEETLQLLLTELQNQSAAQGTEVTLQSILSAINSQTSVGLTTVDSCVNGVIETQIYSSVDGATATPIGVPIVTDIVCEVEKLSIPQMITWCDVDGDDPFGQLGYTEVEAITIANTSDGDVTITSQAGTGIIPQDSTYSWGNGTDNMLDVTDFRVLVATGCTTIAFTACEEAQSPFSVPISIGNLAQADANALSSTTTAFTFTPNQDIDIVSFEFSANAASGNSDSVFEIRDGIGLGGTVIATSDVVTIGNTALSYTVSFASTPRLLSGQSYTFTLQAGANPVNILVEENEDIEPLLGSITSFGGTGPEDPVLIINGLVA